MKDTRSKELVGLRPEIKFETGNSSEMENFQNAVLRPILKFQSAFLVRFAIDEAKKMDKNFSIAREREQKKMMTNLMENNVPLRNSLVFMSAGLIADSEIEFYFENKKEIHKRLLSMIKKRVLDQYKMILNLDAEISEE